VEGKELIPDSFHALLHLREPTESWPLLVRMEDNMGISKTSHCVQERFAGPIIYTS